MACRSTRSPSLARLRIGPRPAPTGAASRFTWSPGASGRQFRDQSGHRPTGYAAGESAQAASRLNRNAGAGASAFPRQAAACNRHPAAGPAGNRRMRSGARPTANQRRDRRVRRLRLTFIFAQSISNPGRRRMRPDLARRPAVLRRARIRAQGIAAAGVPFHRAGCSRSAGRSGIMAIDEQHKNTPLPRHRHPSPRDALSGLSADGGIPPRSGECRIDRALPPNAPGGSSRAFPATILSPAGSLNSQIGR
jgi:hypothetical protein